MRKKKIFAAAICLLVLAVLMYVPVTAADAVTVQLPFSVRNVSGTVAIEALDGAPLPEQTVYENVTDGTFAIPFSEAGTYHYRVRQRTGGETDVRYDGTVYEAVVAVLSGEDKSLSTVLALNKEGDTHKLAADEVVFENIRAESGISLHKTVSGIGDKSREWHFTVTLTEKLSGTYGDIEFQDGVGHVTLRHGETAVASGLFPGVGYRVTEEEANQGGYKTIAEGAEGTTADKTVREVSFENRRTILSSLVPTPGTGDDVTPGLLWVTVVGAVACAGMILFARSRKSGGCL